MGLKDLKSTLDASILGVEGNTVANATPDTKFNTLKGTTDSPFQGKNGSGDHLKDLLQDKIVSSTNTGVTYDPQQMKGLQPGPDVPGQDQDLDGMQGPQFQRPTDIASQVHESSLALVPGGDSNSPFQDKDGLSNNPSFGDPGGAGKQLSGKDLHESLLTEKYQYSHNTPVVTVNEGSYDLNGLSNTPSFGDPNGAGKQLSNKDLHESLLTEQYQYSHSTPVVTINAGAKDMDGGLPLSGEYLNNLPS